MELALNTAGLDFSITDQAVVAFGTDEVGGRHILDLGGSSSQVSKPAGQPPTMPGWLWPCAWAVVWARESRDDEKYHRRL